MIRLEAQIRELASQITDKESLRCQSLEMRDKHALTSGEVYYNGIINRQENSHQPFLLQDFIKYHTRQWLSDLSKYYDIDNYDATLFNTDRYPMVVHLCEGYNHKDNVHRNEQYWKNKQHLFMFSIATFHMFLECQTIGKLYGYHVMEQFHRATWLPLFINDAGGTFHPIYCIGDSYLYPLSVDVDDYVEILDAVRDYLIEDSASFFKPEASSVNFEAHRFLLEKVNVKDFLDIIKEEFGRFRNWIKDPSIPYPERHFPGIYDN